MSESIRVLYIAGAGRSGSTLLARILGQVPGLVAAGELRNLLWRGYFTLPEDVRCGCGKTFASCPFWTAVRTDYDSQTGSPSAESLRDLMRGTDRIRYLPGVYLPVGSADFRRRLVAAQHGLVALYSALLRVGGAGAVVDSSKDLSLLYILARLPAVELSVLHLVRDGRAVAHSLLRKVLRVELLGEEKYLIRRAPLSQALDWWYRNVGVEAVRGLGVPYLRVRYEDLADTPRPIVRDILRWFGHEESIDSLDGHVLNLREADHQAAGNPARFATGPIAIRPDTEWMSDLTARRRRLVTLVTWPLLMRYRYSLRSGRPRRRDTAV